MDNTIFRTELLTNKALSLYKNRIGYRDDTLFSEMIQLPTDRHDPLDVVMTEIVNCGKYEICDFMILHYGKILSRHDYRLLERIVYDTKQNGFPALNADEREHLVRIIDKLVGSCNYCVWLCANPMDIYNYYIKEYIPKAIKSDPEMASHFPDYTEKSSLLPTDYISQYVTAVEIPDNMVFLCDIGNQGSLVAYSSR